MRLPATQVFIHHTVTGVSANLTADVRTIEAIGLQRFGQFSYSYVIHPNDGEIFEGCGLRRGAHTAQKNSTSFGIAWIGNYSDRPPKVQQVAATRWLIAHLKAQGHLTPNAEILPHNAVFATACPGSKLTAMLDVIRQPWEGPKEITPMFNPPLQIVDFLANPDGPGGWGLGPDGGIYGLGGCPWRGVDRQPLGKAYWEGRKAARLEANGRGYTVVATSGERYDYP
jgi:hypothetical protein